jgi:hypothetical protein
LRVALVLSGQPRCLDECFESLKKFVIEPYHPDIFFHFWNFSFAPQSAELNKMWYEKESPTWERFDSGYAYKYIHLMRPKRFIVEPQVQFDTALYQHSCTSANSRMQAKSFTNVLSMFYSIARADLCRVEWEHLHNSIYDVVIRCRTDLMFHDTPNLTELEKISIPKDMSYGGLNDQFAFSNSYNMLQYSSCYSSIERLFRAGTNFHPETLLRDHIQQQNIPVRLIETPYRIVR